MKKYLLSIYQPDGPPPPPEVLEKVMGEIATLIQEAKAAGVWVFNGGLHPPSTATVVRLQGGELLMTDGPFAEGKEHVGGCLIIMAPDLDSAGDAHDRGTLPLRHHLVGEVARRLGSKRSERNPPPPLAAYFGGGRRIEDLGELGCLLGT